jgi:hypothetical protein
VQLPQLKRIRWAVRAALILGVAASVAANVLHALPNPISQTISAWPPLALLLTVELTSRIPMHRRSLAVLRVFATMAIAGIAAWVSYWHMQSVAHTFGESASSSYLLPISVDGLIVVASVSLVELAGRIRMVEDEKARAASAPAVAPVQFMPPAPVAAPVAAPVFQAPRPEPHPALTSFTDELAQLNEEAMRHAPVSPAVVPGQRPYAPPLVRGTPVPPAVTATTRPAPATVNGSKPTTRTRSPRAATSTPTRTVVTAKTAPAEPTTPRAKRPVQEAALLADEIEAMNPRITEAELAAELGVSVDRLRTIRRESTKVG